MVSKKSNESIRFSYFQIIFHFLGKHCLKPTCEHTYLRKGNVSDGPPIQETKVLPSHDPTVS